MKRVLAFSAIFVLALQYPLYAQQDLVAGKNVNMVGGPAELTVDPFHLEGDPNLQRQNEISMDCSMRNPLHCLASANDYRLVDVAVVQGLAEAGESAGDAWLGYYWTTDGGARWRSFLHPGHPRDPDLNHPLKPYQAAADATVRCTTNGLCFMSGIAFNRGKNQPSAIFISRVIDNNNKENGSPFAILGTTVVARSNSKFLDKTWIEVDRPRAGAQVMNIPAQGGVPAQSFAVGVVYLAWTEFVGNDNNIRTKVMVARSLNGGVSFEQPTKVSEGYAVNQGITLSVDDATGALYIAWRQFKSQTQPHSILIAKSTDFGKTFTKATPVAAPITPFEQGTSIVSFRTTAYPTMKALNGNVYVAWSQRSAATGDGRIVLAMCSSALVCSAPVAVDDAPGMRGHQFMPALAARGNQLAVAFLDAREDHTIGLFAPTVTGPGPDGLQGTSDDEVTYAESRQPAPNSDLPMDPAKVFTKYLMDAVPDPNTGLPVVSPRLKRRHTIDVRMLRINLANPSMSGQSVKVSSYPITDNDYSYPRPNTPHYLEQLKFFAGGLPLFMNGRSPFIGDYIDAVAVPRYLPLPDGTWAAAVVGSNVFHVGWADNRDVRPPADGNWENYTPVTIGGVSASAFDPSQARPACYPGQTGMRNQNPYTALVTDGLLAGSLGNSKRLGIIDDPFNPGTTVPLQRAFTVFVQNATAKRRAFRLTIQPPPNGVTASFLQFGPALSTLDVEINPYSSASRTVFVTAPNNPSASVNVTVQETQGLAGLIVSDGLSAQVILNPDLSNPDLANPDLSNPDLSNQPISGLNASEVYNPDLSNPDLSNPDLSNPDLANPDLANPDLANVSVANPDLSNPDLANPDLANPDLSNPDLANVGVENPDLANPDLSNPDLANASITDTTWTMTNNGNTSASYTVKLLTNMPVPQGIHTQLILHRIYTTPTAAGCTLEDQTHSVLVASVPDPAFISPASPDLANPNLTDGSVTNTTVALAPGDTVRITVRVYDPIKFDAITFNPAQVVAPAVVAQAVNTETLLDPQAPDVPQVTVPPGVATALAFVVQPQDVNAGQPMPAAVQVHATDPSNAGVAGMPVTLSLVSPAPGPALLGTLTATTDATGVASFPGLAISADGIAYRLAANGGIVASATSSTFNVGSISFEMLPDGTPACNGCAITNEFASRGVIFSFDAFVNPAVNNFVTLIDSTGVDPAGPTNHSIRNPGDVGSGFTGTMILTFPASPRGVSFRLRAPTVPQDQFVSLNVVAYDPNGVEIPAAQFVRTGALYTPSSACCGLYRQEAIAISNAGGIGRVEIGAQFGFVWLDNLAIDPYVLVDFPPTVAGGGDFIYRGFYVPSYPGTSLSSVTVWMKTLTAGTYTVSMTARANAYDGPVIGTSTAIVALPASLGTDTPVTFYFPGAAVAQGSLVTFAMTQVNPAGLDLYYDVGDCGLNDPNCPTTNPTIETEGTNPSLDTFRRKGVNVTITGAPGIIF